MFIVLISGLPGSGKSFFARKLSRQLNSDYINSDLLRKELFINPVYSKQEKDQVYAELYRLTELSVLNNKPVIVDATFHKSLTRHKIYHISNTNNCPLFIIEIHAKEELIKERLKEERVDSDADFEIYQLIKSSYEPLKREHLKLESGTNNIDQMLSKAQAYIKR